MPWIGDIHDAAAAALGSQQDARLRGGAERLVEIRIQSRRKQNDANEDAGC
jgi:hypothetical protein